MSHNDLRSRRSRESSQQFENSSIKSNRSRHEMTSNASMDLPRADRKSQNKYAQIERDIIIRKQKTEITVINLQNTRYPIITEVIRGQEQWRIDNGVKGWDIKWCDTGVTTATLTAMNAFQRINHFPSMAVIARKNGLAASLAKMRIHFQADYDFYPRTFLYPAESVKLKKYTQEARKRGLLKTFIVKPEAGCQGKGIYLSQNLAELEQEERCVVQKYISNPLLYDGLKFDLRVYVLISSCQPLRIYIYNEGLVRLATEHYKFPEAENLDNLYMHLTNYAINKAHPSYEYNSSVDNLSQGHKKSLAQFFKELKDQGFKANLYWSQIKDIIVKTIIAGQPQLNASYKSARPNDILKDMCFEVLGFDFMLDNRDKCFLLEVNHTPSFSTDTPLDALVKSSLIKDTLLMMDFSNQEIKLKEDLEVIGQREKIMKIKPISLNVARKNQIAFQLQDVRAQNEQTYIGTYEQLFPNKNSVKQTKYQKLLECSIKDYTQDNLAELKTSKYYDQRASEKQTKISRILEQKEPSRNVPKDHMRRIFTEAPEATKKDAVIYSYMMKKMAQISAPMINANSRPSNSSNPKNPSHSNNLKNLSNVKNPSHFNQQNNSPHLHSIQTPLPLPNSRTQLGSRQSLQTNSKAKFSKVSLDGKHERYSRPPSFHKAVINSGTQSTKSQSNNLGRVIRQVDEEQGQSGIRRRIRSYKTPLMY